MKFKCLILDHDDTAVDSTASVHFPAHLEVMKKLRPGEPAITLDTWFEKNFHPGIMVYLTEEIGLDEKEMEEEFLIWQDFNSKRNPPFYAGLPELMEEFIHRGGIIAVASHSTEEHIRRHYQMGAPGITPEFIFGWDHNPEKRKPSPWPVFRIMEETNLDIEPVRLLKVVEVLPDEIQSTFHYVILDYMATIKGGQLMPGDDALAVGWFGKEDLNQILTTSSTRKLLQQEFGF